MKNWKGNETRRYYFADNGQDYIHPDHGSSYVYRVNRVDEKGDPKKDWSMFIKPGSSLAIGAQKMLTESKPILFRRTFEITKKTGASLKDTRYDFVEVFEE